LENLGTSGTSARPISAASSAENIAPSARFQLHRLLQSANGVETWLSGERETESLYILKRAECTDLRDQFPLLQRELEAMRSLGEIVAYGREGKYLYFVRRHHPGTTLAERLALGALSPLECLKIARSALQSLSKTHDAGLLHRDLKPSNLILGKDGSVTLIDFGFSLRDPVASDSAVEARLGTALYAAPEQAGTLDRPLGPWTDLYSLGCVLFEALAGRPPFQAENFGALLRLHLTEAPSPLRALRPDLPSALDAFVQHLLAKEPQNRYRSCSSALADLECIEALLTRRDADPEFLVGLHDPRSSIAEPAFVGRKSELAMLGVELDRARQGRGGLVLLEGESGGGKTRILREFASSAGWTIFGQGVDQVALRPFQVLSGVIEAVLRRGREDLEFRERLARELDDWREPLCELVPDFAAIFGISPLRALGPEALAEIRSVQALSALLDRLGTDGNPCVVVLDDCQWADELSLKLISFWQQKSGEGTLANRHVMMVASFRSEEVGPHHRLRQLKHFTPITLPPFHAGEVKQMVESMAGRLPLDASDTVASLSAGNPFMASAILQGLFESGTLRPGDRGWRVDPESLREVRASRRAAAFLSRRLKGFPPELLRVLSVGAVLGKEFRLAEMVPLLGTGEAEIQLILGEAVARKVVWAQVGGQAYTFVHDKIRETVLSLLSEDARRSLHLQAANGLEALAPNRCYELAYHFAEAGRLDRAFAYAYRGATLARGQHSLQISEKYFRIAERGLAYATDRERFGVLRGLGEVLLLQGKYPEAEAACRSALAISSGPEELAEIRRQLGDVFFKRGDVSAAAAVTEDALRSLGRHVPRHAVAYALCLLWEILVQTLHCLFPHLRHRRAHPPSPAQLLALRLYSRLAYINWFGKGGIPCAWAHLREMNQAETFPETLELAQAYSEHAPVMTMLPWFRRGLAYAEKSLVIRRHLGDLWGEGQSLHFLGVALYGASRFEESLERCGEAVRVLERTGDRWEVNTASWHRAAALYRLGRLAQARDLARQTYQAGMEIGDSQACGLSLSVWAKATEGQVPTHLIDDELKRSRGDLHTQMELLQARAICRLYDGDSAGAIASLREADRLVTQRGLRQEYMAPILPWLCTALRRHLESLPEIAVGEKKRTRRLLRKTLRRAYRLARFYRNNFPQVCREWAYWHALQGKESASRRLFTRSLREAEKQGASWECALTREAQAEVGTYLGWPGARESLNSAREELARLRATLRRPDPAPATESSLSLLDRFSSVLSAGHALATALDRDSLYSALCEHGFSLFRSERCFVLEFPDGKIAVSRRAGALTADPLSLVSQGLVKQAIELQFPVTLNQTQDLSTNESILLSEARSVLCAPISVRGSTVACLYVTHDQLAGLFGETEIQIARFLTTLASAALENAEGFARVSALSEERARLSESATAALRARDEFLSMASHELKTPLTSALLQCQILLRRLAQSEEVAVPKEHAERSLRISEAQLRQLKRLIDDLMNVSQVNSGHFELEREPLEISRLVFEAVENLRETCRLAKCEVRLGPMSPTTISGDRGRIYQVLSNILVNATKYAAGAPIEVTMDSRPGLVRIHIRDHGPGIPPELHTRIFDRFDRGNAERAASGLGLGLFIANQIMRSHGGRILLSSEPNNGSLFTLEFPAVMRE
jgi:signal transduction histidine kinase/tetratricopeptide (TPR) repeat protein